jgi:outer membrane protein TolC
MRRTLRIGFVILLTIILAAAVSAETYTLDKCIQTALRNNYGVIAAKNTYDVSRWSERSAWGNILPTISVSLNRQENWATAVQYVNGIPIYFSGETVRYGGNLNFSRSYAGLGLGTFASIKRQRAEKGSSYFNFIDTRDELVLTIKEAFFNVIKSKMLVEVSKDAVRRGEEQLRVAQSRYELGSASLSDVLKAKVSRSNAKLELITSENNYELAKANLGYGMGIDVTEEIKITEEFPEASLDVSYDIALNEALSRNPSYRKAGYDLSRARADHWLARTNFLPSLSLYLSHTTSVDERDKLFDLKKEDASYYFGITLSYNIFNGLSDYSNLKAAGKSVNTFKENLENTKNSVSLEVKQSYLDVQQNAEKLNLNEESVAAAQEDLNIVREKYNLGAATIIEVLDAEVLFKQAQVNQVQAQFDYHLAISRLEKVMGR